MPSKHGDTHRSPAFGLLAHHSNKQTNKQSPILSTLFSFSQSFSSSYRTVTVSRYLVFQFHCCFLVLVWFVLYDFFILFENILLIFHQNAAAHIVSAGFCSRLSERLGRLVAFVHYLFLFSNLLLCIY